MAIDQATADYEQEQATRESLDANRADWTEPEIPHSSEQFLPNVCAQCVNWQPARQLRLADGTTPHTPGFCIVRAAADLPQMPQAYAENCRFYEEDIPF